MPTTPKRQRDRRPEPLHFLEPEESLPVKNTFIHVDVPDMLLCGGIPIPMNTTPASFAPHFWNQSPLVSPMKSQNTPHSFSRSPTVQMGRSIISSPLSTSFKINSPLRNNNKQDHLDLQKPVPTAPTMGRFRRLSTPLALSLDSMIEAPTELNFPMGSHDNPFAFHCGDYTTNNNGYNTKSINSRSNVTTHAHNEPDFTGFSIYNDRNPQASTLNYITSKPHNHTPSSTKTMASTSIGSSFSTPVNGGQQQQQQLPPTQAPPNSNSANTNASFSRRFDHYSAHSAHGAHSERLRGGPIGAPIVDVENRNPSTNSFPYGRFLYGRAPPPAAAPSL